MAQYDLNIMQVANDGDVAFEINNTGGRSVGLDRVIQQWIKLYYNAIVRQLSGAKNDAEIKAIVNIGMTDANITLKERQTTQDLQDIEKFVGCSIKRLDIEQKTRIITLDLNFKTVASTTVISV